MKRLMSLIEETLGTQLVGDMGLEERQRHVRSAAFICIVCGTGFAFFNMAIPGMAWLGLAELVSVVFFFVPAALLRKPAQIEVAEHLLLLGALLISSSLIVFGGVGGTGLLWVYSVPFLVFFIKGQRQGWYYSLVGLAVHVVCMVWVVPRLEVGYPYSDDMRLYFCLSMGFCVVIAATFNHARSRFESALQLRKNEAEAASRAKSRFLAAASHDLRQPAHALGLFVARLQQLPQDAPTRELVAGVDASVHALQDMLDAFFDYSRLDSQLTHANPRSFDLNPMFDSLHTSFAGTAQQRGLRLRVRPAPVWVHSDPVLLHRVLLNLLSNAVQHTPQGSVLLACRVSRAEGMVRIQVRDSGIGIASAQQAKVFEEFYQVENPERDRSKGLGLGLSIVERSCKLLGHPIELHSALGCGSTFTLRLPLGTAEAASSQDAAPEAALLPDLQGMQVLLLEDDALGSVALKGLLQSWGCSVVEAASAKAALASLHLHAQPHCIVSDYRLAGAYNGVQAILQLRQQLGQDVAACVISGDADDTVKDQTRQAGLILLQKPVKPAKLRSVLRHAWTPQSL